MYQITDFIYRLHQHDILSCMQMCESNIYVYVICSASTWQWFESVSFTFLYCTHSSSTRCCRAWSQEYPESAVHHLPAVQEQGPSLCPAPCRHLNSALSLWTHLLTLCISAPSTVKELLVCCVGCCFFLKKYQETCSAVLVVHPTSLEEWHTLVSFFFFCFWFNILYYCILKNKLEVCRGKLFTELLDFCAKFLQQNLWAHAVQSRMQNSPNKEHLYYEGCFCPSYI